MKTQYRRRRKKFSKIAQKRRRICKGRYTELNGWENGWLTTKDCIKYRPITSRGKSKYYPWNRIFEHNGTEPVHNNWNWRWIWVNSLCGLAMHEARDRMIEQGDALIFPQYGMELKIATIKSHKKHGNFCHLTFPHRRGNKAMLRHVMRRFKHFSQRPVWVLPRRQWWRMRNLKKQYTFVMDALFRSRLNQ